MCAVSCMLIACGKDDGPKVDSPKDDGPTVDNPDNPEPEFVHPNAVLSFSTVTVPKGADSFAFRAVVGGAYTVASDAEWCSATVAGNAVCVSTRTNDTGADRRCTISVVDGSGTSVASLALTQLGADVPSQPMSGTASTKSYFFPYFTATWCPFTPLMDDALKVVASRLDHPVLPMQIHVAESELYCPLAPSLAELYGNNSVPEGYFDHYADILIKENDNVSVDFFWNRLMQSGCSTAEYAANVCSLSCTAAIGNNQIDAKVTLTPTVTEDYRLNVWIVEDGLIAPHATQNDGIIEAYKHDNVLRGSLTPIEGVEMHLNKAMSKTFTFTGSVPEHRDVSNLRLIIVMQRDDEELNNSNSCWSFDKCWVCDNCLTVNIGASAGFGGMEQLIEGEEIEL